MPRYFFHIHMNAGLVFPDQVGIQFCNLAAAQADAKEAVRQTNIEKKIAGEPIEMDRIEIADRSGRVLAVVDFDEDAGPNI